MASSKPERRYRDILEACEKIDTFTAGHDRDSYLASELVQSAVERQLQIIAEAASKIGERTDADIPELPWRKIKGIGNVLRHEYDLVSPREVWRIVSADLVELREAVRGWLARNGDG